MAEKLTRDLNIIQNSDIEITVDPITANLNIIQQLDDEPNDVGGLSAAELKAKFDEAGNTIKTYINDSLIPQVLSEGITEAQREENEDTRQTAEAARETAEAARVVSETGRVAAESARETAESARESAEAARESAEAQRRFNDAGWGNNESRRMAAERVRESAETARASAETERESAEGARAAAETERESAEGARASAEAQRQTAESARVTAETGRVSAENARVQAEAAREDAQTAFFQGVSASAELLPQGSDATASAAPSGGSFHVSFGIPAGGPAGAEGKSAYSYAVDGGYTGTEAEFQALMGSGPWLAAKDNVIIEDVRIGGIFHPSKLVLDGEEIPGIEINNPNSTEYDGSIHPVEIYVSDFKPGDNGSYEYFRTLEIRGTDYVRINGAQVANKNYVYDRLSETLSSAKTYAKTYTDSKVEKLIKTQLIDVTGPVSANVNKKISVTFLNVPSPFGDSGTILYFGQKICVPYVAGQYAFDIVSIVNTENVGGSYGYSSTYDITLKFRTAIPSGTTVQLLLVWI